MAIERLIERIETVRSRIESQLTGASVINVASVRTGDGADALATLLAYAFTRAGHSTLLIESSRPRLSSVGGGAQGDLLAKIRREKQGTPDVLRVDFTEMRSASDIKAVYDNVRTRYEISISSHSLDENPGGLGLASMSDLVVVSVLKGRAATDGDRQLMELLGGSRVAVLGVVTLEPSTIKAVRSMQHSANSVLVPEQEGVIRRKTVTAV